MMNRLKSRVLLLISCCLISLATHADALLKPFSATYQFTSNGLSTTATRTLSQNSNGSWSLTDNASYLFFQVVEQSIFRLENNNLQTQQYRYEQGSNKDFQLRFDWEKGYVFSNYKKEDIRYNITPDTTDRLTLQLQLQRELYEKRGPDSTGRLYAVADDRDIKHYHIKLAGVETLTIGDKTYSGIIHLQQQRPNKNRINHIWLDPAQNYQMIKFEQWEKNKKTSEMVLLSLQ